MQLVCRVRSQIRFQNCLFFRFFICFQSAGGYGIRPAGQAPNWPVRPVWYRTGFNSAGSLPNWAPVRFEVRFNLPRYPTGQFGGWITTHPGFKNQDLILNLDAKPSATKAPHFSFFFPKVSAKHKCQGLMQETLICGNARDVLYQFCFYLTV